MSPSLTIHSKKKTSASSFHLLPSKIAAIVFSGVSFKQISEVKRQREGSMQDATVHTSETLEATSQ